MWRKVVIAVLATMALGLLAPQGAFADDGYRAGGDRAAAIGASRAEYRHRAAAVGGRAYRPAYRPWRRFPVAPVAVATAAGAGIAYSAYRYGYGNYYANGYGYYPPYGYVGAGDAGFGGCAIIHRPVPTAEGWVMQPIQVCN